MARCKAFVFSEPPFCILFCRLFFTPRYIPAAAVAVARVPSAANVVLGFLLTISATGLAAVLAFSTFSRPLCT